MKYMKLEFPFDLALQFDETVEEILGDDCVEIPAIFGKKGWYAERKLKISWYEFPNGKAYMKGESYSKYNRLYDYFVWTLKNLIYLEHRLTKEQIKAARIFYESLAISAATRKDIQDLLCKEDFNDQLRRSHVETRLYCQKSLKEIREEDSEAEDN